MVFNHIASCRCVSIETEVRTSAKCRFITYIMMYNVIGKATLAPDTMDSLTMGTMGCIVTKSIRTLLKASYTCTNSHKALL